jgi:hypothetical protein
VQEQQLWVEPVGNIIIARIRGVPTEQILRECQERVLQLMKDIGRGRVLYDCLEMEAPSINTVLSQQKLDAELGSIHLRRAIVVPNSRIAYLARLALGEGNYRVFYNEMTPALMWLEQSPLETTKNN